MVNIQGSNAWETPAMATSPNLETIQADLDSLKRDLIALANHVKSGVTERVGDEASRLSGLLSEQGARSVEAVQRQLQEKPLLYVHGAFAVGFLGGRVLSR
jgi:hypothetical protein